MIRLLSSATRQLAACVALAAAATPALGQASLDWSRTFDGPPGNQNDQASLSLVDAAGNVYSAGFSLGFAGPLVTADIILLKYSPNGALLWERRWDGGAQDLADAIGFAANGDILVAGRQDSFVSLTGQDIVVLRYDPQGNLVWSLEYDGPGSGDDRPWSLAVDSTDATLVACDTGSGVTDLRGTLLKIDAGGSLVWDEHYIGPWLGDDLFVDVALDSGDRAFVASTSTSQVGYGDLALLCYDASGNLVWERRHAGAGSWWDRANKVGVDAAGNAYLAGTVNSGPASADDAVLLRYDPAGNQDWIYTWDSPAHRSEFVDALVVDAQGSWLVGSSYDAAGNTRGMVLRVSASGAAQSSNLLVPSGALGSVLVAGTAGPGTLLVAGWTIDSSWATDTLLAEIDPGGTVRWTETWDGGGDDIGLTVSNSSGGKICVAGDTWAGTTRYDLLTLRYSGAAGLQFDPPNPQRGAFVNLSVTGAEPGSMIAILWSRTGIGAGLCPGLLGGTCLGLLDPVQILASLPAPPTGSIGLTILVPPTTPLVTLYMQAAASGSPGRVSQPVTRTVQP